MTLARQDFPPMTGPLRREVRGSGPRLVPVQKENKLLVVAGRWLADAHDPVRLSPEPEVNGSLGPILGMLSWIHFVPFRDDFDVAGVADPGEKRTRFRCDSSGLSEPGYTQPILVAFPSLPPNTASKDRLWLRPRAALGYPKSPPSLNFARDSIGENPSGAPRFAKG
jgi:hypothetical protein